MTPTSTRFGARRARRPLKAASNCHQTREQTDESVVLLQCWQHVTDTTTGTRSADGDGKSIQTRYRGKLFAVVDELISEIDRRFTSIDELLNAMAACDPHSHSFMSAESLLIIADQYTALNVNGDRLPAQCDVARNLFCAASSSSDRPSSAAEVYSKLSALSAAFPDILACLRVALKQPVASAKAEHSFSGMRRIKTHLRASMSDSRLSNLELIAVERELSEKLMHDPDEVIEAFATSGSAESGDWNYCCNGMNIFGC